MKKVDRKSGRSADKVIGESCPGPLVRLPAVPTGAGSGVLLAQLRPAGMPCRCTLLPSCAVLHGPTPRLKCGLRFQISGGSRAGHHHYHRSVPPLPPATCWRGASWGAGGHAPQLCCSNNITKRQPQYQVMISKKNGSWLETFGTISTGAAGWLWLAGGRGGCAGPSRVRKRTVSIGEALTLQERS